MVLLLLCILAALSLHSYVPQDIGAVQQPPNRPAENFVGVFGAWLAYLSFMLAGVTAYLLPLLFGVLGALLVFKKERRSWRRTLWVLVLFLAAVCVVELTAPVWQMRVQQLNVGHAGGELGWFMADGLFIRFLGRAGTWVVSLALLLAGPIFLFDIQPVEVWHKIRDLAGRLSARAGTAIRDVRDRQQALDRERRELEKRRKQLEKKVGKLGKTSGGVSLARTVDTPEGEAPVPEPIGAIVEAPEEVAEEAPPPRRMPRFEKPAKRPAPAPTPETSLAVSAPAARTAQNFTLPSIDFLEAPGKGAVPGMASSDMDAVAAVLEETLHDFGIDCRVTNVECGPVVTRYEVLPAAGVRVERIGALSNNIALALKAISVRVQAPVPGKGVVGIEVPNAKTSVVRLRELLESNKWKQSGMALPLALGKDVAGREMIADLAEMPHLLIAGATGAGKTVCMNSLLAGLLMTRTPDELRLMLIDPKIVEFTPYNGLPHLVVPVITDAKKVGIGLRWAITEMEKRYKMFARAGVKNIRGFNSRPIVQQPELFEPEDPDAPPREPAVPERLPYIVVVVDELADLMLAAQAEIENHIARLAQLSRAVGIHMIIATQRPSVNVITGTIKANFPARIAFQVAQKVDSRTILDAVGAEKLLGKGDMLFLPPGTSKLVRAQGCLTEDREIHGIVEFLRNQTTPEYEPEIHEKMESKSVDLPNIEDHEDELFDAAVEVIRQTRRASTSSLQRRLRIGYTRAARLMDILEEKGIVGPPQGSDPREILIDLDGEIEQNTPDEELD